LSNKNEYSGRFGPLQVIADGTKNGGTFRLGQVIKTLAYFFDDARPLILHLTVDTARYIRRNPG
jgi:hypothetical protein